MENQTPDHAPLTPAALHILVALSAGDLHGYGIMQEVKAFTGGQFTLGPGTLYRSIRQLLEAGLIQEAETRVDPALDDERRRYYQLTGVGRRAAQAEMARLENLLNVSRMRRLYGEG